MHNCLRFAKMESFQKFQTNGENTYFDENTRSLDTMVNKNNNKIVTWIINILVSTKSKGNTYNCLVMTKQSENLFYYYKTPNNHN